MSRFCVITNSGRNQYVRVTVNEELLWLKGSPLPYLLVLLYYKSKKRSMCATCFFIF